MEADSRPAAVPEQVARVVSGSVRRGHHAARKLVEAVVPSAVLDRDLRLLGPVKVLAHAAAALDHNRLVAVGEGAEAVARAVHEGELLRVAVAVKDAAAAVAVGADVAAAPSSEQRNRPRLHVTGIGVIAIVVVVIATKKATLMSNMGMHRLREGRRRRI